MVRRFATLISLTSVFFSMAGFAFLVGEPYVSIPLVSQAVESMPVLQVFADLSLTARFFGAGLTGLALLVLVAGVISLPYAYFWLGAFMDHAFAADDATILRSTSWKLALAWRTTACVIGMLLLTPISFFGLIAAARYWGIHAAIVVVLVAGLCGAVAWIVTSGGIWIRRIAWTKRR